MARNKSHKSAAAARQSSVPMNKLKKDPGVPKLNLKQKQVEKIVHRAARFGVLAPDAMPIDSSQSIAGLAASASLKHPSGLDGGVRDSPYIQLSAGPSSDPTMAAHAHQFKKVLETADVILQVLDARDPLGCRSKIVEEEVLRSGGDKKIILVMNKTDLVPKENVLAWLKYLRHDFPTIPFKSSTQQQRANLSGSTSSKAASKGAPHLLHLLKSIRPAHSSITVGVLGPPNVGKSSLINSIKREKVCTVGAKPGETRALKEVAVERGIKVIDSPGIIWGDAEEGGAFRNVWSLEGLEDPIVVVEGIVSRVPSETLRQMYGTPPFSDAMELLMMIALVRGKLGKGGKPDINLAALAVVHDWNVGKIPFYTVPPEIHPSMVSRDHVPPAETPTSADAIVEDVDEASVRAATFASTSIVKEWGKAFDLDGLWAVADDDVLGGGAEGDDEMQVEPESGSFEAEDAEPMDDDTDSIQLSDRAPTIPLNRSASRTSTIHTQTNLNTRIRRERRPPKRPRERTQRLAPKGVDEELSLLSAMMNRKKVKDEAKKKRRDGRASGVDGDVDMSESRGSGN